MAPSIRDRSSGTRPPSSGPKTVFGKATKPAACSHSYWADKVCQEDPALFYAANRERALALRGQGSSE